MAACFICCNEIPKIKLDEEEESYKEHDYYKDKDQDFQTEEASLAVLKLLVDMFRTEPPTNYRITTNKCAAFCFGCAGIIQQWEAVLKDILDLQQLIEKKFKMMSNLKQGVEEVFQEFNHGSVMNKLKTQNLVSPPGSVDTAPKTILTNTSSSKKILKIVKRPGCPVRIDLIETTINVIPPQQQRPQTRGLLGKLPPKRYYDEVPEIPDVDTVYNLSEDDDFHPLSGSEDDSYRDYSEIEGSSKEISKNDANEQRARDTGGSNENTKEQEEIVSITACSENVNDLDQIVSIVSPSDTKRILNCVSPPISIVEETNMEVYAKGNLESPEAVLKDSNEVPEKDLAGKEDDSPSSHQVPKKRGPHIKRAKSKKMLVKTPIECDICHRKVSKQYLEVHKRIHTGEKFDCTYCKKQFTFKNTLQGHIRSRHTGERPYECKQCPSAYSSRAALRYHTLTHIGERPYVCTVCDKSFYQTGHLNEHLLKHKEEKPFSCKICSKRFVTSGGLSLHGRLHSETEGKRYLCSFCPKQFNQKVLLVNHTRKHTQENPFECDRCDKKFHVKACLTSHYRQHTGEKLYLCYNCGKQYSDHKSFKKHKLLHEQEKSFDCETCDEKFTTAENYRNHQDTHNLEQPKALEEISVQYSENALDCPNAEEAEIIEPSTTSTDQYRLKCEVCGKGFTHRGNLNTHRWTHAEEKRFQCKICQKQFAQKVNFKRHTATHDATRKSKTVTKEYERDETGKRIYRCDICDKTYSARGNLHTHKRIHAPERQFQCEFCNKKFAQKAALQRHEQTHTGEKPFLCGLCGQGLSSKYNLVKHMQVIHGKREEEQSE